MRLPSKRAPKQFPAISVVKDTANTIVTANNARRIIRRRDLTVAFSVATILWADVASVSNAPGRVLLDFRYICEIWGKAVHTKGDKKPWQT